MIEPTKRSNFDRNHDSKDGWSYASSNDLATSSICNALPECLSHAWQGVIRVYCVVTISEFGRVRQKSLDSDSVKVWLSLLYSTVLLFRRCMTYVTKIKTAYVKAEVVWASSARKNELPLNFQTTPHFGPSVRLMIINNFPLFFTDHLLGLWSSVSIICAIIEPLS